MHTSERSYATVRFRGDKNACFHYSVHFCTSRLCPRPYNTREIPLLVRLPPVRVAFKSSRRVSTVHVRDARIRPTDTIAKPSRSARRGKRKSTGNEKKKRIHERERERENEEEKNGARKNGRRKEKKETTTTFFSRKDRADRSRRLLLIS